MFQSPAIKDEILKSYIEQIFAGYDKNSNGTLNPTEMTNFFNDLFKSLGIPLILNPQQSLDAIKAVHPTYNGTVNRDELFAAFKVLLGLYFFLYTDRPCRNNQLVQTSTHSQAWSPMAT